MAEERVPESATMAGVVSETVGEGARHRRTIVPIPGTEKRNYLAENARAAEITLATEETRRIEERRWVMMKWTHPAWLLANPFLIRGAFTTLGDGIEALKLNELPIPEINAGEILVEMMAASLNYRDLLVVKGVESWKPLSARIPVSDGVGEVTSSLACA